jgi:hypothetical protein
MVADEREFQRLYRSLDDASIIPRDGHPEHCRICEQASCEAGKHHAVRCERCTVRIDAMRSYYVLPEEEEEEPVVAPRSKRKRKKTKTKTFEPFLLLCGVCKPADDDRWQENVNCVQLLPHCINCRVCDATCHRVCAMVGLDDDPTQFVCPFCVGPSFCMQQVPSFRRLPVTPIADAIESRIGHPLLCVREVFRHHGPLEMSAKVAKQFVDPSPRYCTTRTIFYVYDEIPVFFLYVMEFDKEGAGANSNRVYLDYLDSVRAYSPLLNSDLLDAYVQTVRDRGFDYLHLWCAAAKNEWFAANDPPPRVYRDDVQLLAWYQNIFARDEAFDYFDLIPAKVAFPKKFDALPIFPDLFLQFLEAKGSASQNSEVIPQHLQWDNIRKAAYLRYWKLAKDDHVAVTTYDESGYVPSSSVCRSRDTFVEFQVDKGLRMSDYRCARHFSATLAQALLDELK